MNKEMKDSVKGFILLIIMFFPLIISAQQNSGQDDMKNLTAVNIPGTKITMTIPDVFIFDESQSAYIYNGAAASIAVKELNGSAWSSVAKGISTAYLEKQGMKLLESSEFLTKSGLKGMIYTAEISVKDKSNDNPVDYIRLILITGNQNCTVWVTMNFPQITRSLLEDVMKKCLYTVELD